MNEPTLLQESLNFFKSELGRGFLSFLNSIFGAGLGAAFYILIRTQKYLVNRSFDPKYNNVYLARFATGVVSGFLLSIFIKDHLPGGNLAKLTPGMIAILGGFSAEAVEQILQRMVEVLVTFVRGDGAAQAKAELTATKTKLAEDQSKKDSAVREKLADLKNIASADPTNSTKVAQAVADIQSLLK